MHRFWYFLLSFLPSLLTIELVRCMHCGWFYDYTMTGSSCIIFNIPFIRLSTLLPHERYRRNYLIFASHGYTHINIYYIYYTYAYIRKKNDHLEGRINLSCLRIPRNLNWELIYTYMILQVISYYSEHSLYIIFLYIFTYIYSLRHLCHDIIIIIFYSVFFSYWNTNSVQCLYIDHQLY